MGHVKALSIKLVVHLLWAWVLFSLLYDFSTDDVLILSAIIAVLIYVVGDLFVLRKGGNIPATILDSGTAFLIAWFYLGVFSNQDALIPSLIFAVGVAIFEWFFHDWLLKNGPVPDERSTR